MHFAVILLLRRSDVMCFLFTREACITDQRSTSRSKSASRFRRKHIVPKQKSKPFDLLFCFGDPWGISLFQERSETRFVAYCRPFWQIYLLQLQLQRAKNTALRCFRRGYCTLQVRSTGEHRKLTFNWLTLSAVFFFRVPVQYG